MRARILYVTSIVFLSVVVFSAVPLQAAPDNVITVTNNLDETSNGNGCSLREAIINANNNAKTHNDCAAGSGADQIRFAIGSGTRTIAPNSELPTITDPVTIDGTTQPSCNAPCVVLDGVNAGGAADGLELTSGNSTVRGLVIHRFGGNGIYIWRPKGGYTIVGNYVGIDVTGTQARANGANGVYILAPNNTVGGTNPSDRNVISGNRGVGLLFCCSSNNGNNRAINNFVGTNAAGTAAIPNHSLGLAAHSTNNIIGGTTPAERNLVSGNVLSGISMCCDAQASGNRIIGNWVGVDVTGTKPIPNIENGIGVYSPNNFIGGTAPGERNLVSGNQNSNVSVCCDSRAYGNVIQGNWLGPDVTGKKGLTNTTAGVNLIAVSHTLVGGATAAAKNRIAYNRQGGIRVWTGEEDDVEMVRISRAQRDNLVRMMGELGASVEGEGQETTWGEPYFNRFQQNAIYGNRFMGIDLHPIGVQSNDAGDGDGGPNFMQNYPQVNAAFSDTRIVKGKLKSKPNQTYTVEFFMTQVCDESGFGEGKKFLGAATVTTKPNGNAKLKITSGPRLKPGAFVTATATDSNNNTSEFSRCMQVQ